MFKSAFKVIAGVAVLLLAVCLVAFAWATYRLSRDDATIQRPSFEHYVMGSEAADGSLGPSPTGYRISSAGVGRILPPMPPEKPMDVHTHANYRGDLAIRSCFWPGPRARSGVYTNDANSFAFENQYPDTATTYVPTAFRLPAGAKLVIKGDFPHMRHWNFNIYNPRGEPQDALSDIEIEPDTGSFNPFRSGVSRNVKERSYTFTIVNGRPVAPRPANTLYTSAEADKETYLWMRNYVPDHSSDYLGSVALPKIELLLADGRVLQEEAACDATNTPMRGKQLASSVDPSAWVIMTHLPWVDTANVGAVDKAAVPFKAFFNRQQVVADLFAPLLSPTMPELIGGWWSNQATRYGYAYFSRNFGKVYVVSGKMPVIPKTWAGETDNAAKSDMRYMSICTGGSLTAASTTDCIYDEQLVSSVDDQGRFAIVVSRQQDKPANATPKCGVTWIDMGNGDGMVSGSAEFGAIINRHTLVNQDFKHSWFAVQKPGAEQEAMGDYLPYLLNLKTKERFESLGCPVDKSRLMALLPR